MGRKLAVIVAVGGVVAALMRAARQRPRAQAIDPELARQLEAVRRQALCRFVSASRLRRR